MLGNILDTVYSINIKMFLPSRTLHPNGQRENSKKQNNSGGWRGWRGGMALARRIRVGSGQVPLGAET